MNAELKSVLPDLLQALEHLLEANERTSALASTLIQETGAGRLLPLATPSKYTEQLERTGKDCQRMRQMISQWWESLGRDHAH